MRSQTRRQPTVETAGFDLVKKMTQTNGRGPTRETSGSQSYAMLLAMVHARACAGIGDAASAFCAYDEMCRSHSIDRLLCSFW
jgi:hypothetical protein